MHSKKQVFHIFIYIFFTLLFAGCKDQTIQTFAREAYPITGEVEIVEDIEPGQYGGVFIYSESGSPRTFNSLITEDLYSFRAINYISGALTGYDWKNQRVVPALAKSWTLSPDNIQYRFNLRKGIQWSDGHPFTADDVIFTLDAIFDDRYPNRGKDELTFDGVPLKYAKIDDYTLEFTLQQPQALFEGKIGGANILPKHKLLDAYNNGTLQKTWNLRTAIESPKDIVSLGPYIIEQFIDGERIVYSPNPYYWRVDTKGQRLPYISRLIYKIVPDINTQLTLFATGQMDTMGLGPRNLTWLKIASKKYGFDLIEQGPDDSIGFFWLNMKSGVDKNGKPFVKPYKLKWFQQKEFRQALSYAINREGFIEATYFSKAIALNSNESPANKKWFNPNLNTYAYSPQKALKLLSSIKFTLNSNKELIDKDGNKVEIEYLTTDDASGNDLNVLIAQNLKDIGIELKLTYVDFGTLIERTSSTFDYEMVSLRLGGGAPDPSASKSVVLSKGRLHPWNPEQTKPETEWEAEIDRLFNLSEHELDEPKRIALWFKIQEIFNEQQPLIMLFAPFKYIGIKNYWKNLKIPPCGNHIWNLDELYQYTNNTNSKKSIHSDNKI